MRIIFLITVFCVGCCFSYSQTISTFAGIPFNRSTGPDGYQATATPLNCGGPLAIDSKGSLYVTTIYYIKKISPTGIVSTYAGNGMARFGLDTGNGGPATAAPINATIGMAFDRYDNLFFAGPSSVRMIDTFGILHTVAGAGLPGFGRYGEGVPASAAALSGTNSGLFVDTLGRIFFCDSFRIKMVDTNGLLYTYAGNGTAADTGDGGPATAAALMMANLTGDNKGNIYAITTSRIRKITPEGRITTIAGQDTLGNPVDGAAATASKLHNGGYCGITVDALGNLYFTQDYGASVWKINNAGMLSLVAGTPGVFGHSGDGGPATAAELWSPWDIKVSPTGDIYFTELGTFIVRKITRDRTAVPLFGTQTVEMTVAPNPTRNQVFTLNYPLHNQNPANISIVGMNGALAASFLLQPGQTKDFTVPAKGIYLLRALIDGQIITKKLSSE